MKRMKKKSSFFIAVVVFLGANFCLPLIASSQPIPPFKMILTNNKIFSAKDLPKGKPMILIYFDPECGHCQKLMSELFKKINEFKKAEMVMVSFKPVSELAAFEKEYNTQKYVNIKVGTEGTSFFLRMYYGLTTMPFTALYDRKGNLSYSYRKETSVADLIIRLKKVQ
jgi:thioredoxin-related protein